MDEKAAGSPIDGQGNSHGNRPPVPPRRKNKPCSGLSNDENEKLFNLLGRRQRTLATTLVRLTITNDNNKQKQPFAFAGELVACLVIDLPTNSYSIAVFSRENMNIVFSHNLLPGFLYEMPHPLCMEFEMIEGSRVSILFENSNPVETCSWLKAFNAAVKPTQAPAIDIAQPSTSRGLVEDIQPNPKKKSFGVGRLLSGAIRQWSSRNATKGRMTKSDIGTPTTFTLVEHGYYEPDKLLDNGEIQRDMEADGTVNVPTSRRDPIPGPSTSTMPAFCNRPLIVVPPPPRVTRVETPRIPGSAPRIPPIKQTVPKPFPPPVVPPRPPPVGHSSRTLRAVTPPPPPPPVDYYIDTPGTDTSPPLPPPPPPDHCSSPGAVTPPPPPPPPIDYCPYTPGAVPPPPPPFPPPSQPTKGASPSNVQKESPLPAVAENKSQLMKELLTTGRSKLKKVNDKPAQPKKAGLPIPPPAQDPRDMKMQIAMAMQRLMESMNPDLHSDNEEEHDDDDKDETGKGEWDD